MSEAAGFGAELVARLCRGFPEIPLLHLDYQSHPVAAEFPADVPRLDEPCSTRTLLEEVAQRLGSLH